MCVIGTPYNCVWGFGIGIDIGIGGIGGGEAARAAIGCGGEE